MDKIEVWTLLINAGVPSGVQHAVENGEHVSAYLDRAMLVIRPHITNIWGSVSRDVYAECTSHVVAYLMATDEQILEVVGG